MVVNVWNNRVHVQFSEPGVVTVNKQLPVALQNTQSLLRVSCQRERRAFVSTDKREQSPSSAPGVTAPALVSRQHERVALPCLLLKGLSLEKDLPTSR